VLNNAVNRHDLTRVVRLARRGELWEIARRLATSKKERVRCTWSNTPEPPTNWWNLPNFAERWNRRASGDPAVDDASYIASRHLGAGLSALSLGCGSGGQELRWAATGCFSRLVGVDLSEPRVEAARAAAAASDYAGILEFRVGNAETIEVPSGSLDAVIGAASLHHLTRLRAVLERARRWLKPGGLMLVNEFVGPTRFQWTNRQLEAANALLELLPERLRREPDGRMKSRVVRPSHLVMRLGDPSEAVESSEILPALDDLFERVELCRMGGTLSHLVFAGIAQNFAASDLEARQWADLVFDTEDLLMDSGEIASDYVVGVWRRSVRVG
jgi:SAM-dependent methyltransferase